MWTWVYFQKVLFYPFLGSLLQLSHFERSLYRFCIPDPPSPHFKNSFLHHLFAGSLHFEKVFLLLNLNFTSDFTFLHISARSRVLACRSITHKTKNLDIWSYWPYNYILDRSSFMPKVVGVMQPNCPQILAMPPMLALRRICTRLAAQKVVVERSVYVIIFKFKGQTLRIHWIQPPENRLSRSIISNWSKTC